MKFDLSDIVSFKTHRSGWGYCMNQLKRYHCSSGILIDSFIEKTFSWDLALYYKGVLSKNIPYKRPWIGFLHNPPNMPKLFDYVHSPEAILNRNVFIESLKTCLCLVTLSEYLKNWLKDKVKVPVVSLRHPTEIIVKKWNKLSFLSNKIKNVIQLGYWLRRLDSIFYLNTGQNYRKIWLPGDRDVALDILRILGKSKIDYLENQFRWAGVDFKTVSNQEFDDLMTNSIVFLDLYDSSANNAIVEAMARNTPILVNKLDATVEYLGEDYPLYFDDIDHASYLLRDIDNIFLANEYLKNMNKDFLSGNFFANDFISKVKSVI